MDGPTLQELLDGVDFPARKDALLAIAREQGADQTVLARLEQLPDGMTFASATEVSMQAPPSAEPAR